MQVAFHPHEFLFHQREHVGEAERRQRLPEFLPDAARGAQREAVVGRDERTRRHLGHAAFLDAEQGIGVVDGDHEGGVDEAAAADELGVGVHEVGDLVDHAKSSLKTETGWNGARPAARTLAGKLARPADRGYLERLLALAPFV